MSAFKPLLLVDGKRWGMEFNRSRTGDVCAKKPHGQKVFLQREKCKTQKQVHFGNVLPTPRATHVHVKAL